MPEIDTAPRDAGWYMKKPVAVLAVKVTDDNLGEVAAWCGGVVRGGPRGGSKGGSIIFDTLEGR